MLKATSKKLNENFWQKLNEDKKTFPAKGNRAV